jgi:integrase
MFILKRTNSPYWYARIQTVNGPVDKSTKTRIKREAKKIGKQWQDEADLIKASKTGGSKLIVPTLLYLADQATSGSLETKTLDTEVNKIRRILSDTSCGIPLGIYLDQWVSKKKDIHESTRRRYRQAINYIKELPESKKGLAELTRNDCLSIVNAIKEGGKGKRKGATINILLTPLTAGMADALYNGLIDENHFKTIERAKTYDSKIKGYFEIEEIEAMLKVASHTWKGVMCVGLFTGMRIKDCVTLKWGEVDFKTSQITKRPCKQRYVKTEQLKKTPIFGELEVYMKSTSLALASGYKEFDGIEGHSEEWCDLFNSKFGNEFLFPKFASTYEGGGQGEPLPTSFTLQVRKKAGVPKKQILDNGIEAERTFHSFRHTTAFLMQRSNISEDDRREVLGHEDSAVHKIYMKPSSEAVARALKSSIPKELVAVS